MLRQKKDARRRQHGGVPREAREKYKELKRIVWCG